MIFRPFKLERFFAEHEFSARRLLSASDCESLSQAELLAMAGDAARQLWDDLWLGYTESQGHPLLREEIARGYVRVRASGILVAAPEEGIFLTMAALLSPGDQVIVTWPAYQSLYAIAGALGAAVVRWPLEVHHGCWQLDLERLPGLIGPHTRLLVVNFPHNPTGFLPSPEAFAGIMGMASRAGLHVLSDEMYRLLEFDAARRLPAACDLYERGITLSGLSKAYGLPGLRIGWLATRDPLLLESLSRIKDYTTICSSAPSEVLALIALRSREAIVSRNLEIIGRNLAVADGFFSRHEDLFEWLRPLAGSVAFPRAAARLPIGPFCRDLLAAAGVMLAPGELFEMEGNHFRLGLGRKAFPEALAEMEDYLRQIGQA